MGNSSSKNHEDEVEIEKAKEIPSYVPIAGVPGGALHKVPSPDGKPQYALHPEVRASGGVIVRPGPENSAKGVLVRVPKTN